MWKITLGNCGPTDCCLCLHKTEGDTNNDWKMYAIESTAWKILDRFFIAGAKEGIIVDWLAQIIWDDMDGDTID